MNVLLRGMLAGAALLLAVPALAQINETTPARQRAENRRAIREARKQKNPYQSSHLDVGELKEGQQPELPRDGRQKYKFDHEGIPRVNVPISAMVPRPWLWFPKKHPKKVVKP